MYVFTFVQNTAYPLLHVAHVYLLMLMLLVEYNVKPNNTKLQIKFKIKKWREFNFKVKVVPQHRKPSSYLVCVRRFIVSLQLREQLKEKLQQYASSQSCGIHVFL